MIVTRFPGERIDFGKVTGMDGWDEPATRAWVVELLDGVRRHVHQEVRTRRLVVVDSAGRELVVIDCERDGANVQVASGTAPNATRIDIRAARDGDGSYAGVCLERGGDVVGELFLTESPVQGTVCRLVFDDPAGSQWAIVDREGFRTQGTDGPPPPA